METPLISSPFGIKPWNTCNHHVLCPLIPIGRPTYFNCVWGVMSRTNPCAREKHCHKIGLQKLIIFTFYDHVLWKIRKFDPGYISNTYPPPESGVNRPKFYSCVDSAHCFATRFRIHPSRNLHKKTCQISVTFAELIIWGPFYDHAAQATCKHKGSCGTLMSGTTSC